MTSSVAARPPTAVGVNFTGTVVLVPGATVIGRVAVAAKSLGLAPDVEMLFTTSVPDPVLVIVMFWPALAVPTVVLP